jgi:hypothetical protein
MVSVANSIGLDYPQDSVQVCVLEAGGEVLANRSCPNEYEVIRTVGEQWGPVGEVAIESCNGAADLADGDRPLLELARAARRFPDDPNWPRDGAAEHDHYLYGTPKRNA